MKLVKALNGDWVNVAQASSFNVADFGNRAVVYARVGNVSYELFESLSSRSNLDPAKFLDFNSDIPNPDYLKQAERFLEDMFTRLGAAKESPSGTLFLENALKELNGVREVTAHIAPVMKSTKPVKRTTRKKADPDV